MNSYSLQNAYSAYRTFIAIRNHFSMDSYDYFRYNGKISGTIEKFDSRRDKFLFYKLGTLDNILDRIVSNFIYTKNEKIWVNSIIDEKGKANYQKYKLYMQSLSYNFGNEIMKLDDDFRSNFSTKNGNHPNIIKLYSREDISLQTLVIMDNLMKCFSFWKTEIPDDPYIESINKLCSNYQGFFEYDRETAKKQIKRRYNK